MLSKWALCDHINLWFGLIITFDNFLDFVHLKIQKSFLNLEDFPSIICWL